jgi:hypothetical protein
MKGDPRLDGSDDDAVEGRGERTKKTPFDSSSSPRNDDRARATMDGPRRRRRGATTLETHPSARFLRVLGLLSSRPLTDTNTTRLDASIAASSAAPRAE